MTDNDKKIILVGVAVEKTVSHFDKCFDYILPPSLYRETLVGCRVMIPFGNGNSVRQGMIMYVKEVVTLETKYKEISSVIDDKPVLSTELVGLVEFMKEHYFCTFYDAVKTILPTGINYQIKTFYSIDKDNTVAYETMDNDEQQIYTYLSQRKKSVLREEIVHDLHIPQNSNVIHRMYKKGILDKHDETKRKTSDKLLKMIRIKNHLPNVKLSDRQQDVLETLIDIHSVSVKELCYFTGCTKSIPDTLVKKGFAEYFDEEVFRTPYLYSNTHQQKSKILLTDEQQNAYNDLEKRYFSHKAQVSLLYGITGSGKTSVFMKLIDTVSDDGKGIIVMVPEISLTPQMINLFTVRYGDTVAVFHSGLSVGERLDEWKRVKNGYAKIVIGTRSAVFAPFDNLGLIIMDEEQEYTYKSEANPRFHARDIAKYRCHKQECLLLLSSATPSVESFYHAQKGRYSINTLTQRYGKASLPEVIITDMNPENEKGNVSGISTVLMSALEENLYNKRQSIILLNRRGHNTFVSCKNCNEVISCPNCSISLTYHSANNRMMCHYCGYSQPLTHICPVCHGGELRFSGLGTQRIEQTLNDALPDARILRLDADSTMAKFSHEKKLNDFATGKYDIMIGTQMVAKGLNFPNVTLVGVLSADLMLYADDYRSYERTFSLLTQVVGRSGRGDLKGKAIIQTFTPNNDTIVLASQQDYDKFYENEIVLRKAMLYPPFSDICMVGFTGDSEPLTYESAKTFTEYFIQTAEKNYADLPLRVIGFSPATVSRINNKYRYKCVIKCRNSRPFRKLLSDTMNCFSKNRKFSKITVYVDINPDTIL